MSGGRYTFEFTMTDPKGKRVVAIGGESPDGLVETGRDLLDLEIFVRDGFNTALRVEESK